MSQDKNQLILDVKNLVVRYETEDGVVHALNGIDLQLGYRQTIGLVGETGAGKTTAALAILRLVPDPPGVVECDRLMIEGRDILNLPAAKMDEVRGKDVSMIFQDPMTALNPVFTVGEQIAESLQLHEGLDKNAAMERAKQMLELVGGDRHRPGLQSQAPHRRRAHHRPGCDHPGPGAGADERA